MYRHTKQFLGVPGEPRLGLIVNLPPALKGHGVHGLPPHAPAAGYEVNRYPACPEAWPRSHGTTGSFFIAVKEGCGMWLDFNGCHHHAHDVAVVVSIQGINPLTGRQTDKRELERYSTDSSVEVWLRGYQNYLATTATPVGLMWIDGFRAQDGTVRQYLFTKDEARGVAAQLIGVNRVFAIGATFFTSKKPKPSKPLADRFGFDPMTKLATLDTWATPPYQFCRYGTPTTYTAFSSSSDVMGVSQMRELNIPSEVSLVQPHDHVEVERLEIGAGVEIEQTIYRDHVPLDYWNEVPAGTVIVNYASADEVERIIKAGEAVPDEGFLGGLIKGAD